MAKAEQRLAAAQTAAAQTAAAQAAEARPDRANITDPDSRLMKRAVGEGWMQAYNAQDAVNAHQIVFAAEVTQDPFDVAQLLPMIAATETQLNAVGVDEPSARCWSTPATGARTTPPPKARTG